MDLPMLAEGSLVAPPPEPPPNSKLVSAYAYPNVFALLDDAQVDVIQTDMVSIGQLDQGRIHSILNEMLVTYEQQGQENLAYIVYEETLFNIRVPTEFCIGPFCLFDWCVGPWCWIPPHAGEVISVAYRYRFWMLSRERVAASQVAAAALPILWFPALILALIALIGTIAAVIGVATGQISFRDLRDWLDSILRKPGENIETAIGGLTGPLMAFGFTMVAAGIFIPMATSKLEVSQPIPGGGRVTTSVGSGAAPRAPAPAPRRR